MADAEATAISSASMATTARPWTVLPHGTIEKLSSRLWTVSGALPNMPLQRRMTIVRREDDSLLIHSAIPLDDDSMREIEAWGKPAQLIVPNGWHRLDAGAYVARYPALRVYCPRAAMDRVQQVVRVHGAVEDMPADSVVSPRMIEGLSSGEAVFIVRDERGAALVFNDLLFNHKHVEGAQGFVMRMLGSTGGPKVTRVAKAVMISDRSAVAKELVELANMPRLYALIPGHGDVVIEGSSRVLASVALRV